jgi:hypothetical protein
LEEKNEEQELGDAIEKMRVINYEFLGESVTTRSNNLVMIAKAKNEVDRKKQSPFAKLGRIGGQSIRGWLRHAVEKLLLQNGVSICHPLNTISVTADRTRSHYQEDLAAGYHSRGDCKTAGGCLIYNLFGDLEQPGNLIVQSVYFFPTMSGDSTATKNINKFFNSMGSGRVEVVNNSPRCRTQTHIAFMTIEHLAGVMIEAPFKLILRQPNPSHEVIIAKALEFLNSMVKEYQFDFLLGGMRSAGYGRAALLPIEPKTARKRNKNASSEEEMEDQENIEEEAKGCKIQFNMKKEDMENLENEFQKIIASEVEKFPIKKEESPENA